MISNRSFNLSREQLAQLGREYMLFSQFNSRTGYGALKINHGEEAYSAVAIDNWMAASPVYTQRMQRAMGFSGGTDVGTIFKGLQLECGFTHQYFDVHFKLESPQRGRFWLPSCGPLLEAEPRGEEAVRVMCHDIEDPTFDATAVATNPRARMRPVHRPPRKSAAGPHCEWIVEVVEDAEPLSEPLVTQTIRSSQLASLVIDRPASNEENGGMDYYDGELFEQLQLEQFSHSALVVICKEIAVQCHLLIRGLLSAVAERYGEQAAKAIAEFQMIGSGQGMSERLVKWLGCEGEGIEAIEKVLALHPAFQPGEYQSLSLEKLDERQALLHFQSSAVHHEADGYSWMSLLQSGCDEGLTSLIKGIDKRASCQQKEPGVLTWLIELGEENPEEEDPLAVLVAKSTVLYQTQLENHIPLLQL